MNENNNDTSNEDPSIRNYSVGFGFDIKIFNKVSLPQPSPVASLCSDSPPSPSTPIPDFEENSDVQEPLAEVQPELIQAESLEIYQASDDDNNSDELVEVIDDYYPEEKLEEPDVDVNVDEKGSNKHINEDLSDDENK